MVSRRQLCLQQSASVEWNNLSGGEKTVVALTLLFAIHSHRSSFLFGKIKQLLKLHLSSKLGKKLLQNSNIQPQQIG